jgi:glycosyltransferase involved in cell wall biosynthesis
MTADTVGGVWTYALELARALAPHGVAIDLATMGAPLSGSQWKDAAAIPNLSVHESRFRLEWMDDPWTDLERAADWLLTLENETAPDVIHLNGYVHGDLPWRAPHIVVGHSCVLSWWRAVRGEEAPENWQRYRVAVARGLRAADCVLAPSRAMLAELHRYYGPLPWCGVIPNGRDALPYRAAEKEPFIFAAGRIWDEAKNVKILGEVRSSIDWPVCIAGSVTRPDGSMVSIPNLRLLGMLANDQLAHWLSRAAIYCLPALYEPFGLSVLEAAHSGCALVLGDIPSLRENWEGAAVFVNPRDVEALARVLGDLIANPARLRRLAAAAHLRARACTTERMSEGYLGIYGEIVAAATPAAVNRE